MVLDDETARCEIQQIVAESYAERFCKIPWAAAEILLCDVAAVGRATMTHKANALKWLQGANQYCGGMTFALGHGVDEIMDPVVQIHVGETRRTVERRVAGCGTWRRMTGGIVFADVRLGLDDDAGRDSAGRAMHEDLAQQLLRDGERRPFVKIARKDDG